MSERRATTLVGADRTMIRYAAQRPDDAVLRARLRDLTHQRHRFGYRRLFVLLRREGEGASRNRVYRLYRPEGLAVRKRKGRRQAVGTRAPLAIAATANARWSIDFVHDQLACGRRFRILNVVDDATRECLLAVADTSISGKRVSRELAALVARRSRPCMVVSDNGIQFTDARNPGSAVDEIKQAITAGERFRARACAQLDIEHRLIKPKHPWTNGQVE